MKELMKIVNSFPQYLPYIIENIKLSKISQHSLDNIISLDDTRRRLIISCNVGPTKRKPTSRASKSLYIYPQRNRSLNISHLIASHCVALFFFFFFVYLQNHPLSTKEMSYYDRSTQASCWRTPSSRYQLVRLSISLPFSLSVRVFVGPS